MLDVDLLSVNSSVVSSISVLVKEYCSIIQLRAFGRIGRKQKNLDDRLDCLVNSKHLQICLIEGL